MIAASMRQAQSLAGIHSGLEFAASVHAWVLFMCVILSRPWWPGWIRAIRVRSTRGALRAAAKRVDVRLYETRDGLTIRGVAPETSNCRLEFRIASLSGAKAKRVVIEAAPFERQGKVLPGHLFLDGTDVRLALERTGLESRPDLRDLSAALALLDAAALLDLRQTTGKLRIERGAVSFEFESNARRVDALARAMRLAMALARCLAVDAAEAPSLLAEAAQRDSRREVRLHCLEALVRRHREVPATLQTLRGALGHPDAETRLAAARAIGAEGTPVLRALAAGPGIDPEVRVSAIEFLATERADEEVSRIVAEILRGELPGAAWQRLVETVARRRIQAAAPALVEALASGSDEKVRAAAGALGLLRDASAVPQLLRLLRGSSDEVRLASLTALRRTADVSAVAPLLRFADAPTTPRRLATAAREAVAAIQSRIEGAEAGQLSVAHAPDPAGALSEIVEGSLSLPRREPETGARSEDPLSLPIAEPPSPEENRRIGGTPPSRERA